jgi:mRNA-degrading endonuclease HigB of HigAB toxin-antitoxin module
VDIGCNHPIDSNNTFLFYLNNWTGINIDGNEKLINLYKQVRRKDISIKALISDDEYIVNYYQSS